MSELAIDGIAPERTERPVGAGEVADLIREANATGVWLQPFGGKTAMAGANPVDGVPVGLDLAGLAGVVAYTPADMTVSVQAGTRWQDLQETLAEHGQTVPIDVPFVDTATVGGVVATGCAGPRRLRDGTLKDLLLGASYVRGDGLAAKAGGNVVKNVSGFEIPRLLHGSWGSLAVVTSVNLKVLPRHEAEITLLAGEDDTIGIAERLLALTGERPAIASAVIDGTLESAAAAVRLTGRAAPTAAFANDVWAERGLAWAERITDPEASAVWWQAREDRLAANDGATVSIEIGCAPVDVSRVLSDLRRAIQQPATVRLHASPGVGALMVSFPVETLSLSSWTQLWTERMRRQGARFVVIAAPRAWRAERDVWCIEPGPRRIMQALKTSFDPNDTLNRGRLWTAPVTTSV